ncbi:MAG TPA: DsbE family thiol:disulfide interchange protein [Sphingomicrobium sp.]|nr:DsbE family thiol:disulfide interchange protein [Sphingomicrobium sp.]
MSRAIRFAPFVLLGLLLLALAWRLATPKDDVIRSRLAGQPVPEFVLPAAVPAKPPLASADLAAGEPRLLNIFASWCLPCIAEAPVLDELKRRGVKIDGIAIRDRPRDIAAFLARHGDPFERIGADYDSRVQLALGSAGVPESFVVDGKGVIRHQHVGVIDRGDIPAILAELEKAR